MQRVVLASRLISLSLGAVLTMGLIGPAHSQVLYGTVLGTASDASGGLLEGAKVTLASELTAQTRSTVTSSSGVFSFSDVPAGTYTLEIAKPGFQKYIAKGVQATINTVTRIDAKLPLGQVSEAITVSAAGPVLQSDKADVHVDLSGRALTELPLSAYRNYQTLINLVPGATPAAFQNSINDTPMRDLSTNINGTNRNNNNTRLDGSLDKMNVINTHTLYVPPVESIETVNVSTDNFDAEQGMAGGASITVVTKSGTDRFHGSVFGFNSTNFLGARNFFFASSKAPKSIDNIDGGSFGGPIKKDRLFFFGDFEGLIERKNISTLSTVATPDQRAGDFSKYGVTLYDPSTGNANGTGRSPFPGALIPASLQSPITLKLQSFVPLPNLPGVSSNYFSSASQALNRYNEDMKVNWNPTNRNSVWAKYSRMDANVVCAPTLGAAGGQGQCTGTKAGTANTTVQLATLGSNWIATPTLLVDGTLSYFRLVQNIVGPFYGQNFGLNVLGIPGTNGADIRESGQPMFTIAGYSCLGDCGTGIANPGFRTDAGFTYNSNLTWNKGSHSIRFGFELIRYQQNDWQCNSVGSARGLLDFEQPITGLSGGPVQTQYNAYAAFLLGLPYSVAKDFQYYVPQTAREWQFGWYGQDRWQISKNLTVTLGLRYEYYPLFTRTNHVGIERYDPSTNDVLIGGQGGNPDTIGISTSHKLLGPRLGFAYRLDANTVIRGGYGISTDPTSTWSAMQRIYPVSFGTQFLPANTYTPWGPIAQGIPPISGPSATVFSSGSVPIPSVTTTSYLAPGLFRRGYIESSNLTLERKLPLEFIATVAYVGTHTVRELVSRNINYGSPGSGTAGEPLFAAFGRTASTSLIDPAFGANYNSLQATLNRRFAGGLMLKGSYTFSRAIDFTDDAAGGLIFVTPSQIERNRALAGFDRTHMFVMSAIYEIPFGPGKKWLQKGFASRLVRSWQFNTVFSSYTGTPFTVTASAASLNAPGNTQTANQIKQSVTTLGGIGIGSPWFDTSAFAPVTAVAFGSTGRNILRGPGLVNMDVGLFRSFALTERFVLQFRAEGFNISNTPHFDNPNANISTPANFGDITGASLQDQRVFRFSLHLGF